MAIRWLPSIYLASPTVFAVGGFAAVESQADRSSVEVIAAAVTAATKRERERDEPQIAPRK